MRLNLRALFRSLAMLVVLVFIDSHTHYVCGQITNWQTGSILPGTEAIHVGPRLNLEALNTNAKNLRFANLDGQDLRESAISNVWFDSAHLRAADLRSGFWDTVRLRNADLTQANLEGMELRNSDLRDSYL